jgi:hypothetical protein
MRRFEAIAPTGRGVVLRPGHPASAGGRTIFPTTVNAVGHVRQARLRAGPKRELRS